MIEIAIEEDAAALAELIAEYNTEGTVSRNLASVFNVSELQLRTCLADRENNTIFIARANDNELLGYIAVHWIPFPMLLGSEGYISDLLISRDVRGRGIGQELLAAAEDEAKARGCHRLMLNNRRSSDSYKRQFYIKTGFTERTFYSNFIKQL